jgi:hypothetical protein
MGRSRYGTPAVAARLGARLLALLVLCTPAAATHTIRSNQGGDIRLNYYRYRQLAAHGERVIIDGPCVSACTMVLRLKNVCATPRARFGFHSAFDIGPRGPRPNAKGNWAMMTSYPPRVRAWILAHGGLSPNTIYASGRELGVPACSAKHADEQRW